jgi:transcriptional regulator with XRE-family HTH domain
MPKRDKILSEFGRNVSCFRDQAGLSQEKLAEKAEIDRTYLSGIERGVRNRRRKITSNGWQCSLCLAILLAWQKQHP